MPGVRVRSAGAPYGVVAVDSLGTGVAGNLALLRDLILLASLADGGGAGAPGGPAPARPGERPEGSERVAALVELAQQGDAEAFGQLYALYVDTVYRYVYARVGSRATAEDLTSETFVRALRRIDSFSWQGRDIAAWFVTIARNLVMDNAKSARFRLEVSTGEMFDADEHEPAPDLEVLDRLRDRRLLEAVRTLKPDQAECVVLRFFQGLSLAEVALAMGRSEGAVKQLQLRAVRSLARELGDELR
ncbi:sigma-70 family RNA polymerase sigma factor [Lapillicoccus jejuensis]|uniref:RNA polymerase sigma-70 factor (ECF subfamily) n=1 Tax=Lapillicoccus jejuensis TaxID=402171 RepID=A0A542DX92_9MICO|nr:sigma-70 family RNA polymerase sigma factor [Lapillicoccus jejuensis]TQJ07695.1 RNA polymerase sigma-70 factor (ECF subfamily) [Lapillicoccus jejuensis]